FSDVSRVIGIDMSLGSLNVVRRRFPAAFLIQADINALPLKDAVLTAVFSVYNLEHLYYLADALQEIERVLTARGRLLVGLPTEGGLAWSLGRKLSMKRTYSKKYNVDYGRVMSIEHCNTAPQVIRECRRRFRLRRQRYFPISVLPSVHPNLTIAAEFTKR
ncbi:MAG: class I SAM-dependent methyltransferase, partial [Vicinamibacterales bacterium]